jgi:hypothetical protein
MKHKLKLFVSFPFEGRFVPPEWAISISVLRFPPGINNAYVFTKGMKRDAARTYLAEKAIEAGAEYLLFIDDDTAPPPDAPIKLIMALDQADEDVIACGGIYTTKADPPMPLVYKEEMNGPYWRWKHNEVFECEVVATGCMLVRLDGLKDIPKPWFRDIVSVEDALGDPVAIHPGDPLPDHFFMTDDVYFCRKAAAHGKRILAHGGVLPIHISQAGRAFFLPNDAGPLKGVPKELLWYNRFIEATTQEEADAIVSA